MRSMDPHRASRCRFGRDLNAFLETFGLQIDIQTQDREKINQEEQSGCDQNVLGIFAHVGKLADLL